MNYSSILVKYQKKLNLLDNTPNQTTKFRTKNWVEMNDYARGMHNTNSQIRFKTSMLRSSLCDHSDAYIIVKGTITVANTGTAAAPNNADKKVIFKNCAPFTSFISRIDNTQIDDSQYIDAVMSMYNLIEYSDNHSKTSGVLCQFCTDVPSIDANGDMTDFTEVNATDSFNCKEELTSQTENVEIMVLIKYVSTFWRTLEMPLINYKITLDLNWPENCVIVATNISAQAAIFSITDTNVYIPVVTLSTQDNAKLFEQLKPGFKRTINWNKYKTKISTERRNQYLDFLIDPSFQGVNRLLVLPFENEPQRTSYKGYYLPTREIKKSCYD